MIKKFTELFDKKPEYYFSAPGRTELSGNHTDHQHGCVLAAAIDLEAKAYAARNNSDIVRIVSLGHKDQIININDLEIRKEDYNNSISLMRGVLAKFKSLGACLCGMDIYCESTVLKGSGLSSSAAFEVLLGNIVNTICFNSQATPVMIAQFGQWSENNYFGKPCGLMDQMASSIGNVVYIDFEDTSAPVVEKINFDFENCGYTLCVIDTGANHADLTDEYAAIPEELKAVCRCFNKEYLRELSEDEFYSDIPAVRKAAGDRAVLRAMHVFNENKRVVKQKQALLDNDFDTYLSLAKESGRSSYMYLQNVIPSGCLKEQGIAVSLALAEHLLNGEGAFRIQGGGFAGTIQAFVPNDAAADFKRDIDHILGEDSCRLLKIRKEGGTAVSL